MSIKRINVSVKFKFKLWTHCIDWNSWQWVMKLSYFSLDCPFILSPPIFKPISTPILASYHIYYSCSNALCSVLPSSLSLFRSLAVYVSHVAKQKLDWDNVPLISLVESAGTQLSTVSQHDISRDETINTCLGVLKCFPHSDNAQTHPVKKCLRRGVCSWMRLISLMWKLSSSTKH